MVHVLVILAFIHNGTDGGTAVTLHSQEFLSVDSCVAAAKEWNISLPAAIFGKGSVIAKCHKK